MIATTDTHQVIELVRIDGKTDREDWESRGLFPGIPAAQKFIDEKRKQYPYNVMSFNPFKIIPVLTTVGEK